MRRDKPSDRRVGTASGTVRAMLPSVLLPRSPYFSASGSSPMPALSRTMTMALRGRTGWGRRSGLVCRVVVAHGARRADRRDRVLEHHMVGAAVLDDHREAIEVLDAAFEVGAVHQSDLHGQ